MIYAESELKENETMRIIGISDYSTKPTRGTAFRELDRVGAGFERVE